MDLGQLQLYYDRIYPFATLYRWLTYGKVSEDPNYFAKREFSLSLIKGNDDIYMRWMSFKNPQQFKDKMLKLDPNPHKVDIGAVYNIPINDKETNRNIFRPVSKELVFDIDMNDYDAIRTCCSGKVVCKKCWVFINLAMRVIEASLKEDFGFQHILWVFSGRRGIHCWVCDQAAREMSTDARGAVADYMNLVTGTEHSKKNVYVGPKPHPVARRAYHIASEFFPTLLEEQDFFNDRSTHRKKATEYVSYFRSKEGQDIANDLIKLPKPSEDFWIGLQKFAKEHEVMEVMLAYSYPRLDINVSKDMGHLLKAPFCVHHATGKICVPISDARRKTFDPNDVPTLSQIRQEFLDNDSNLGQTSLGPYIQHFEEFVRTLTKANKTDNW